MPSIPSKEMWVLLHKNTQDETPWKRGFCHWVSLFLRYFPWGRQCNYFQLHFVPCNSLWYIWSTISDNHNMHPPQCFEASLLSKSLYNIYAATKHLSGGSCCSRRKSWLSIHLQLWTDFLHMLVFIYYHLRCKKLLLFTISKYKLNVLFTISFFTMCAE